MLETSSRDSAHPHAKSFKIADEMYLSGDNVDAILNILEDNGNI